MKVTDSFSDSAMIRADSLTKRFGSVTAADEISFSCRQGEIVGFLGPNGAGKTTTMRMLTGFLPPTSGSAYIAGYHTISDSIKARQRLGYLPETVPLYPEMSVESYLAFIGRLRKVDNLWDRVDDVLEAVDMLDHAETFISRLSKGMRQRVGLAQALIHDPEVLILDEPTIGLDPAQILEVRELIGQLGKRHTILLSTHILSEVEQICNRVIMIIDGRIWTDMSMADVSGLGGQDKVSLKLARSDNDTDTALADLYGVKSVNFHGDGIYGLELDGRDETRTQIAQLAVDSGWGLLEMANEQIGLEAIFLDKLKEAERAEGVTYGSQNILIEKDESGSEANEILSDGES